MSKSGRRKKSIGKKIMRFGANAISLSRPFHAGYVGHEILTRPDYHSNDLAGHVMGMAILDKVDGWMGRAAGSTKFGEFADQLADKSMTHILLGAIAARAVLDGDINFAKFIFANQVTIAARDIAVTRKRAEAAQHGIPTKAQALGKYKTGVTNVAIAGLVSSYGGTDKGKKRFMGLLGIGTGMSVVSGVSMNRYLNGELESRDEQLIPGMPNLSSAIDKVMSNEPKEPFEMIGALVMAADEVAQTMIDHSGVHASQPLPA